MDENVGLYFPINKVVFYKDKMTSDDYIDVE